MLIPKGNLARDYIELDSLTKHGAHVDEIIIYETVYAEGKPEKLSKMLIENELDILCLQVRQLLIILWKLLKEYRPEKSYRNCVIACIGPVDREKSCNWIAGSCCYQRNIR